MLAFQTVDQHEANIGSTSKNRFYTLFTRVTSIVKIQYCIASLYTNIAKWSERSSIFTSIRPIGYERVYMPLGKVAYMQRDIISHCCLVCVVIANT